MDSLHQKIAILTLATAIGQGPIWADEAKTADTPNSQIEFGSDVLPIMKSLCFDCHGNKRAKAELNLEALGEKPDFFRNARVWERVTMCLAFGKCPLKRNPNLPKTKEFC